MRVLHVISSVDSRAGGPAVAMSGLCKAQRGAGLDVSVLATWKQGQGQDLADDFPGPRLVPDLCKLSGNQPLHDGLRHPARDLITPRHTSA